MKEVNFNEKINLFNGGNSNFRAYCIWMLHTSKICSPNFRERKSIDVKVYSKDALTGVFAAVLPALEEWDGYTPTDLYGNVIEDSSTTPPPGADLDGENTMSWGTIDGPGGIIGVCYYWYYASSKEMVEFDIVFDVEETWSTVEATDAFDVQNIATHEAGHTLVLGDLRSPKDGALTMHAYTWLGDTVKRTLGSGDISGVQAIYGE